MYFPDLLFPHPAAEPHEDAGALAAVAATAVTAAGDPLRN